MCRHFRIVNPLGKRVALLRLSLLQHTIYVKGAPWTALALQEISRYSIVSRAHIFSWLNVCVCVYNRKK